MRIEGSTFLITGGASGLGAATARMAVEHGARAVIADVSDSAGEALAHALGTDASFVHTDVTDRAGAAAAVARALEAYGALHAIVNCAGVVHGERVLGRDGPHALESFARVIAI